ncbi:MAG: Re/Si-specific NAD(P)(+) transhydrogenase subunit alpha, partial [Myxococcota bacterium]
MRVLIPHERAANESRVAATPETVGKLKKKEHEVLVEKDAGLAAGFTDAAYEAAGATVVPELAGEWGKADVVAMVGRPEPSAAAELKEGAVLVGFLEPDRHLEMVKALRDAKVSAVAMELIPRITRAQSMDALSSQASLGGYKAALLAAAHLDKYFPLLMTAAGTIQPARAVIMGAGVAGLQAIATCRRLGATVEVSDIREAVREEVESLGGRFIDLPMEEKGEAEGGYAKQMSEDFLRKQREIVAERLTHADLAITTALIPGRPAPKLISEEMVKDMRPGAVIVDMAIARGGNCALSQPDEVVKAHGVTILAPSNLPATVPADASRLYARNVETLLGHLCTKEGELQLASLLEEEDEIA